MYKDCVKAINEYLSLYPELKKHYMNLSSICEELCKLDVLFPPQDLWTDYYDVKDLKQLINISIGTKKKIKAIC